MKQNLRHKLLSMTRTFTRRSLDLRPRICTQNSKTQVLWLSKFVMFVMFECHCASPFSSCRFCRCSTPGRRQAPRQKSWRVSLKRTELRKLRRPTRLKHPRLRLLRPRAGAKKDLKRSCFLVKVLRKNSNNWAIWIKVKVQTVRIGGIFCTDREDARASADTVNIRSNIPSADTVDPAGAQPEFSRSFGAAPVQRKKCLTQQRRRRDQQKTKM